MNPIGVIVARFQSPYLHEGHRLIIDQVRGKHNKAVIVLGIAPVLGSRRNPYDFPTREKMLKHDYPEVVVLPLPDHPQDTRWSQNLDTLLRATFPGSSFLLYGGRDSFSPYYSGQYNVIDLPESGSHSATQIRQELSDKVMDSEAFRTGIIYAYANTYTKVYPTVDIAVFRNHRTEMLLGKKDIDNKWRFMGGFTDASDESYEMAAARELREECGPIETTPMQYETSIRVDDWRYRREEDKIITSLFTTDYISGEPAGSDDIATVAWFKLEKVAELIREGNTAPEHAPQFAAIMKKYYKA